jgi:hypothetical protein
MAPTSEPCASAAIARSGCWLAALACVLWGAGTSAQGTPVRLDGVAAVVGSAASGAEAQLILRSDVELRARMALAGRSAGELRIGTLPDDLLAATLREIVGEHLIEREARRVAVAPPSEAEVVEETRRLARAAGGRPRLSVLLDALAADEAEIERIARRRAHVAAFLRANLEGATVVTDAEVERAYAAAGEEFATVAREVALAQLRARLARNALDRTIARWVAVLKARTRVRVLAEYAER